MQKPGGTDATSRLKALEEKGAIRNHTVVLNRDLVGAGFVVFAMVRTRHHSEEWLKKFHRLVSNLQAFATQGKNIMPV